MCQPGKRLRAPEDEFLGNSGEPLSKRRHHPHEASSGQEYRNLAEACFNSHGVSDDPALLEDFSVFADDDLDTTLPNLGGSTTAPVDDFVDELLFYQEVLVEDQGDDAAAHAGVQPPPFSVVRAFDRSSSSADDYDPNLLHSPPKSMSTAVGDGACESPDLPLTQEPDWESVRRDLEQSGPSSKGMKPAGQGQLLPLQQEGGAAIFPQLLEYQLGPRKFRKANPTRPFSISRTWFKASLKCTGINLLWYLNDDASVLERRFSRQGSRRARRLCGEGVPVPSEGWCQVPLQVQADSGRTVGARMGHRGS